MGQLKFEKKSGEVRFAAVLEDEQGYPLLLSGRLVLPKTVSAQAPVQ